MNKKFLLSVGLLAGTIIGAGIFSLPYVFSKLGILPSILYLGSFAFVYCCIHWMYAELIQKHYGKHEFVYLAEQYLPKAVAAIASFVILVELIFVLVVYLTLAPSFFSLAFGLKNLPAVLVFWFLGSAFIFARLKIIERAELLGVLSILFIVALVFFAGRGSFENLKFFQSFKSAFLFLPFGPLLFAFSGRPAISRMIDEFKKSEKSGKPFCLKRAVFLGTLVPAIVYLFFVIVVLRLAPDVLPDALSSLGFLPVWILRLLGFLGIITIWTSYFMLGINVREILKEDSKKPVWFGVFAAVFLPLLLYFLGFNNFLGVISFTGGVFLALEGIFVLAMWQKAFRSKWRYASFLLYPVFFIALGYGVISFFFVF